MKYFAYGMNTNLDEMARRCPTAVCLGPAWLDNFEFAFRTHADIEKKDGARCYGVLWDIDDTCLKALDMLEGYPYYYHRFRVRAQHNGKSVYALVYRMNDQSYAQDPSPGYLAMVTEGYEKNNVPTHQIDTALELCFSQQFQY